MNTDLIEVQKNSEFGRYAIVTRDILPGEILFEEYPFVKGPKPNSPPLCLGCYCPIDGTPNGSRCPECRWPLCQQCIGGANDHAKECELFVKNKIIFHNVSDCRKEEPCMQLDFITPLRLLLEKEANPDRWKNEICAMEFHEIARQHSITWKADETNVVGYMHGPCKLKNRFSKELIRQACGILEINSFEARTKNGYTIRCIFPKTAIMAHSCVPNTTHSILPSEDFKIKVYASVYIEKSDLAYATYTYTLSGTSSRQSHLKSGKYFTCQCQRCMDPTELGTNFSSIMCNKCKGGIITSTDPLNENAQWNCSKCNFTTNSASIRNAIDLIQNEVNDLEALGFTSEKLDKTEMLLHKYRQFLHSTHFIQTNLRQSLIEMYGRVQGYELQTLPTLTLQRKKELCVEMLQLFDVLQPGMTRTRALLLYELHGVLVLIAKNQFENGKINGKQFKIDLQNAIDMLKDCKKILDWEDQTSQEARISRICKTAICQLNQKINEIQN